jgi:carbonic anhydrase/acetyltransferase-like protein (isoleucine patch superfamily)
MFMLIEHQGALPRVDATTRVAPNATICGDVTVGPNCSIGFGAVITAESGPVRIGANCVIMDTAVIRGVRGNPVTIGENVMIGPRAYLCGCAIEDEVFLATGATVFNGALIRKGAEVRINGLVHLRTALPAGATVPINWVAVGDPAQILPPDRHDDIWAIQKPLDFPRYVFGIDRPPEGESIMRTIVRRYARALGHWHAKDRKAPR